MSTGPSKPAGLRWESAWTWADGLLDADVHVGLALEKQYALSQRSYAPTRLEQYARCPYRFHLQSILGLRAPEQPAAIQRMAPGFAASSTMRSSRVSTRRCRRTICFPSATSSPP